MFVFWSLASLVRNSVVLAVYLLFSVACFFTVHEHFLQGCSFGVIRRILGQPAEYTPLCFPSVKIYPHDSEQLLKLYDIAFCRQDFRKPRIQEPGITDKGNLTSPSLKRLSKRSLHRRKLQLLPLRDMDIEHRDVFLNLRIFVNLLPIDAHLLKFQTSQPPDTAFDMPEEPFVLIDPIFPKLLKAIFAPDCQIIECIPVYFLIHISFAVTLISIACHSAKII
ncbi:hypothetical protein D3Z53_05035 [Lachnospiraceae bacterium]|nr:hypothetical protein [Lachnospiraceae bacterium]